MEAKENLQNGGSTLFSVYGWPRGMNLLSMEIVSGLK
jgi:hypothetical protein